MSGCEFTTGLRCSYQDEAVASGLIERSRTEEQPGLAALPNQAAEVARRAFEQVPTLQISAQTSLVPMHTVQLSAQLSMFEEFEAALHPDGVSVTRHFSGVVDGRRIHTYYVEPQSEAVVALRIFLQRRPEVVLTPLGEGKSFKEIVAVKSCVVIQEWSRQLVDSSLVSHVLICLSQSPRFKTPVRGTKRDPLSGETVSEPVRCTQGHIFERTYIQAWSRQQGNNICPLGNQHPLMSPGGDLNIRVDEALRTEIADADLRYARANEAVQKAEALICRPQVPTALDLVERGVATIGIGLPVAVIGGFVAAGPGALIVGAVGCVVGAVTSGFGVFSWFANCLWGLFSQKPIWEDDVRALFSNFMMEKFSSERVSRHVIEANSRALNDMIPYCRNEDIRSALQKILESVREGSLSRL